MRREGLFQDAGTRTMISDKVYLESTLKRPGHPESYFVFLKTYVRTSQPEVQKKVCCLRVRWGLSTYSGCCCGSCVAFWGLSSVL